MQALRWPDAAQILGVSSFSPPLWIRGGQLQTIIGKLTERPVLPSKTEKVLVAFEDGDSTEVYVDSPVGMVGPMPPPTVYLFHGLGGCCESNYLLRIARKLTQLGIRAVRCNHRGAGSTGAMARKIYHAGSLHDIAAIISATEKIHPTGQRLVIGFSLSGVMVLNLVAEGAGSLGLELGLSGAMAVCAPLDLEQSSLSLSKLRNRHFDIYFTRMLRKRALELHAKFPEVAYPPLPKRLNLRLFDEVFTAPVGGFRNRDHYYESNSPLHKLRNIKIPTMILQAADDPVVPRQVYRAVEKSDAVHLAVEPSGGHMGFVSQNPTEHGDRRWMDLAVLRWCLSILKRDV